VHSTGVQWPEKMNRRQIIFSLFAPSLLAWAAAFTEKEASDDSIYDHVKRRLANDPDVKGGALEIDVKQGVVTLRGTVETDKQRQKAEKLAKKITGVKRVVNELKLSRK
jgi:osmotically-inducible protein OsmY